MKMDQVMPKTIEEVSKSQNIRLIDIWFLGPLMIYLAFKYNMHPLEKMLLGGFGLSTIYYNQANYLANKERL